MGISGVFVHKIVFIKEVTKRKTNRRNCWKNIWKSERRLKDSSRKYDQEGAELL